MKCWEDHVDRMGQHMWLTVALNYNATGKSNGVGPRTKEISIGIKILSV
jgi:hypothetical protein